jgi:hypothetical protein
VTEQLLGPTIHSENCSDYSERASLQGVMEEFQGESDLGTQAANGTVANAMRSWMYQTCNEFGYYQTSRISSDSSQREVDEDIEDSFGTNSIPNLTQNERDINNDQMTNMMSTVTG